QARQAFDAARLELSRLLNDYADTRSTSDRGRRLLSDFRSGSQQWIANAETAMALADAGHHDEATSLLFGPPIAGLGSTVSRTSIEWVTYNEQVATEAGSLAAAALDSSQRTMLTAHAVARAMSARPGL